MKGQQLCWSLLAKIFLEWGKPQVVFDTAWINSAAFDRIRIVPTNRILAGGISGDRS